MRKFKTQSKPKIQLTSKLTPQECDAINIINEEKIRKGITPKYIYVNPKMLHFLNAKQTTRLMIGGRGSGKTRSGIGYGSAMRIQALPRARLFLAGPTFKHVLKNMMGEATNAWNSLEWKEGVDYIKWKKPPKTWEKPFNMPEDWEYIISFRNGAIIEILSMDRPNLIRGISFDGGDWDEFALADESDWQDIVLPTLRGNIAKFNHYLHQNVNLFTSMPRTPKGYHIFKIEENAKAFPSDYFFVEANVYDNIAFWGEKGIERLRQSMTHLKFEIEIMNKRIQRAERAFYVRFNPDYHAKVFHYNYHFDDTGHTVKGMKALDLNKPLDVSFDFGGWFSCCTVSQYNDRDNVDRTFVEFFRDGEDMVRPIIQELCRYFETEGQRRKAVEVYGEPRGHDRRPDGETLYVKVSQYFAECGWDATIMVAEGSRTDEHAMRYEFVNEVFAETNPDLPKVEINLEGCPNLVIALQATAITHDFKKDKSKERDRDYPQQHAPHLTDTLDYKLVQKHLSRFGGTERPHAGGIL